MEWKKEVFGIYFVRFCYLNFKFFLVMDGFLENYVVVDFWYFNLVFLGS